MHRFSKKRNQQIEEDIRAAQLEEALFRAQRKHMTAGPDVITADEITGVDTSVKATAEVSPLEQLRAKMTARQESAEADTDQTYIVLPDEQVTPLPGSERPKPSIVPAEPIPMTPFIIPGLEPQPLTVPEPKEEDLPFTPSFVINPDSVSGEGPSVLDKPSQHPDSHDPMPQQTIEAEDPSVKPTKATGELADKPDLPEAIQMSALPEVSKPYPGIQPEEFDEAVPAEHSEPSESVLQTCMPFILDGADENDPVLDKPLYTLDSLEKILGLEELPPEPPESGDATVEFKPIKEAASHTVISDIDPLAVAQEPTDPFATKTIPMTVMPDGGSVSREFTLPQNLFKPKEEPPALFDREKEADDRVYVPKLEYRGNTDVKPLRTALLKARRTAFLQAFSGVIAALLTIVLLLPDVAYHLAEPGVGSWLLLGAVVLFSTLAVSHAFRSLSGVSGAFPQTDLCMVWPAVLTVAAFVLCIIQRQSGRHLFPAVALFGMSSAFYGIDRYGHIKTVYRNWRLIVGEKPKYAVTLLDDANVTYGMAHRAITGDVLVACGRKTDFVDGFMEQTYGGKDLYGKARLWWSVQTVVALLGGFGVGVFHRDLCGGLVAGAVLACLIAPPVVFAVDHRPLRSAGKSLHKHRAMITSLDAACAIDRANAVVLSSSQLFPTGTVTLHNLTILSENELERTLAEATSITQTVHSPLYPLFKKAMDTNASLERPVADSIKYEESLGLTGWVGDNRIFIGSRKLLEAHEVALPSIEVDRQILSDGYFPVYVARDNRACALLTVRYRADETIAGQLRYLTGSGVTVLINNCDPCISERMVIDYFDLYDESVSVMSATGAHLYKTASAGLPHTKAGAAYKGRITGLLAILKSAGRIRRSVLLLFVMSVITAVLGVLLFTYRLFIGGEHFLTDNHLLWFEWAATLVTGLFYAFVKP